MKKEQENYGKVAIAVAECLDQFETKEFTKGDVLSGLEVILASIVFTESNINEARKDLLTFFSHANDLLDNLYSSEDTNQKT